MTIFRGNGGGGNATTDSELNAISALAQVAGGHASSATDSASSASESAAAAEAAEQAAIDAATGLVTAEVNAAASAAEAAASASEAATSATNAASSASAAAASAATITPSRVVFNDQANTLAGIQTFSSAPVVPGLNGGQLAGLRNKIINGNFRINQKVVSSASTAYAAGVIVLDRWKAGSGGCTLSFSTANNVTTLTITAGTLVQVIEGNNLQSGTHILSWSGTATGRIDAGLYGASGVTATATGGTNLTVEFGTGTLSKVQFEEGSVVTLFEYRPLGLELFLCQRYYCKSYLQGTAPGTASTEGCLYTQRSSTAATDYYGIRFPQTMRTTPSSISIYSTHTGTAGVIRNLGSSTDVAATVISAGDAGFGINWTAVASHPYSLQYVASAEF